MATEHRPSDAAGPRRDFKPASPAGRSRISLDVADVQPAEVAPGVLRHVLIGTESAHGWSEAGQAQTLDKGVALFARSGPSVTAPTRTTPRMLVELVPIPVTDVDRALDYYAGQLGFTIDVDTRPGETTRFVQLTPPGSACSFALTTGVPALESTPGTLRGVHLVVDDLDTTRDQLIARGVHVDPIEDVGGGVRFAALHDPDGNTLLLQQMAWRTP